MHHQRIIITLLPDPDNYLNPTDPRWQEECGQAYVEFKEKLVQEGVDIIPMSANGSAPERGIDLFYLLCAGITSAGGFKFLYDLLKLWIDNRNNNKERVTVKLKTKNFEIDISNISREEALKLFQSYNYDIL